MAEKGYYSDDLELLEEHDLLDSDSDTSSYDSDGAPRKSRRDRIEEGSVNGDEIDDKERIEQLKVPVLSICSALGGFEETLGEDGKIDLTYRLGDDCLGCLRDLRKLWRQDDTDSSRGVARVFAQINLLHNDLVPILLQTAGKGGNNDKISLACTDLLTAMTWPIDAQAEIHDAVTKDDDIEQMQKLPELERAQVQYKSSIIRLRSGPPGSEREVLSVMLRHILLPSLSKPRINRNERDVGVIGMCLHFFRNLLSIRDPVATTLSSADTLANANLQSSLIVAMSKTHVLETLLMLASSSESKEFNPWNSITLECIYHIFVGTNVKEITELDPDQASKQPQSVANNKGASSAVIRSSSPSSSSLSSFLAAEARLKRASILSTGSSRHSRFGTTINFIGPDGERRVARSQAALRKSVEQLTQETINKGKRRVRRRKVAQEKGAPKIKGRWTKIAAVVLQGWADRFMQTGFEALSRSILQDIRSEREKMGDLDLARVRVMQLGTYFLDYFLLRRTASEAKAANKRSADKDKERVTDAEAGADAVRSAEEEEWPFSMVGEWLESWAFKMVFVRSIESKESKAWLEFVAAVQLWTVLLRLVDRLSHSKDERERDAADSLQAQLYYLSETLEACHTIVRAYTAQSFACLDAIITFSSVMPKLLERYSANCDHMYVKARKQVRKFRQEGDLADGEDKAAQIREQAKDSQAEREFKFNDFQRKLATRQLANACIFHLKRWSEYTEPEEQLMRVVGVMHRIAIKAGEYRHFFVGHYRSAFQDLLSGQAITTLDSVAPKPAKDLRKLLDYVLRKFSKLDDKEKEMWDFGKRPPNAPKEPKIPAEIRVKSGFGVDEQIGIAVGLLLQKEKMSSVLWVKSALEMASTERIEILLSHERSSEDETVDPMEEFTPHPLEYGGNFELKLEASTLPELKLLCRMVGLEANEDDKMHWKWTVPARIIPQHLDDRAATMEKYISQPFRLGEGDERPLSALVMKVRKARETGDPLPIANRFSESESEDDEFDGDLDHAAFKAKLKPRTKPLAPKKKPGVRGPRKQKVWTQNNFIEDSDEELAFAMGGEQEDSDTEREREESTPPTGSQRSVAPQQPQKRAALFLGSDSEEEDELPRPTPARSPTPNNDNEPTTTRALTPDSDDDFVRKRPRHTDGTQEATLKKRRMLVEPDDDK